LKKRNKGETDDNRKQGKDNGRHNGAIEYRPDFAGQPLLVIPYGVRGVKLDSIGLQRILPGRNDI
jgi:hypothetical protein